MAPSNILVRLSILALSLSDFTFACTFSPRYECPSYPFRSPDQHSLDFGPRVSCCQAPSEDTCNQVSHLAFGADPSLATIDHGSMGTVYKVQHPITSEDFAVKAFRPADGELIADFAAAIQHEFSVGAAMANHPAFARSYALLTDESLQIHLIMEHVPLALLDLLDHAYWTHDDTHCLFTQLLLAVLDLHDSGFAHRDLKPGNVLLSAAGHAKLIDFGEAVSVDGNATSFTGTRPYIAPELYASHGEGYDAAAADLWSLGMLLLRLYLEDDPWDDSSFEDEEFVAFLDNPDVLLEDLDLDPDIEQALLILLDIEPNERYEIRRFKDKFENDSLCAIDQDGLLHLPIEFT